MCELISMIKLRPYQEQLKADINAAWDEGHRNVLAVMPTGGGKTKTFVSITIDKALRQLNPLPTAIMVHRKELVQQISLTLSEEGVRHNIIAPRPVIKGIVAAQRRVLNRSFYDHMAPVSVISVDTLNARIHKHSEWARKIRFWITDEAAHLLRGNKWGRAVSFFPNAIGLGVTATPQRLDKQGLGSHADGVFDVMVQGPNSSWMIDNGFLSKYKIAIPTSDYESYLKSGSSTSDYSKKNMTEASEKSQIIGDVVVNYKKHASGRQAILFATDIMTARKMEESFINAGIPAICLTGNSTDKDRLDGILEFQAKKIKVLINVDLFDEGLDVPGIECVIMARPTRSLGKFLQMVGRGLRPAPGKEHMILIDHVGNIMGKHGLGRPCKPRKWTLDRIKKKRESRELLKVCWNIECAAPYERELTECPYCGYPAAQAQREGGGGKTPPEMVDGDLELIDPELLKQFEDKVILEDPGSVGQRVSRAAGAPAAVKAMKNQQARIDTQKELVDKIAEWAGVKKQIGLTDREIHKSFYLTCGMTINQALGQTRKDMEKTIEVINEET